PMRTTGRPAAKTHPIGSWLVRRGANGYPTTASLVRVVLLLHPHPPLHRRHNLRRTHGMRRLVIAPDAPRSRAVALEHRDVASRAHDADTGFGEPVAPFTVISRRRHADAGRLTVRGHARIESELRLRERSGFALLRGQVERDGPIGRDGFGVGGAEVDHVHAACLSMSANRSTSRRAVTSSIAH